MEDRNSKIIGENLITDKPNTFSLSRFIFYKSITNGSIIAGKSRYILFNKFFNIYRDKVKFLYKGFFEYEDFDTPYIAYTSYVFEIEYNGCNILAFLERESGKGVGNEYGSIYVSCKIEDELIAKDFIKNALNDCEYEPQKSKEKTVFNVLCIGANGPYLKEVDCNINKRSSKKNISLSYGSNFAEVNKEIISKLNKNNSGIYLLHGIPGTGKTSYIRTLIREMCTKKKVIYLPNKYVSCLEDPNFISFFIDHCKDSIFVMEDAEDLIRPRTGGQNPLCSTLLNMGDGLMADVFNCQIILTFNEDVKNIDKALLRPGRLRVKHEFGPLSIPDAQRLVDHLNLDTKVIKAMTLAEIYELEPINNSIAKDKIGFRFPEIEQIQSN